MIEKLLQPENLRELPRATIGLVVGIGECVVRPFFEDSTTKVKRAARASIQYWSSYEEESNETN